MKFNTFFNNVYSTLTEATDHIVAPSDDDSRSNTTPYDYTVLLIKGLTRNGLMKPVDIRRVITGDEANKGFSFIWGYKGLSYTIQVLPADVANLEVRITNMKDRTDTKTVDLHEEDSIDEVVDILNNLKKEEDSEDIKPVQTSEEPSRLPGGTQEPEQSQPDTSNYLKGL
jgi:hypothetical protein